MLFLETSVWHIQCPEHFQRRMNQILEGIEGVLCLIDDVLVWGKDRTQHDLHLKMVLERLGTAGVTLNPDKCEFFKSKLTFLGHLIDENGIRPDPEKITAIMEMHPPTSITELRRLLGMANQLGQCSPHLSVLTKPLRELLSKRNSWLWTSQHSQTFDKVKSELTKPVLAMYDPGAETKVSADASSGLVRFCYRDLERDGSP